MKHISKIVLAIVLAAFVSAAVFSILRAQQEPSAEQILSRMAEVYSKCNSYRDTGTAKGNLKSFSIELQFKTVFTRPDRFRYEYLDKDKMPDGRDNRFIIWRKGSEVAHWWSIEPQRKMPESLSAAIASATGVSLQTAHTIPALLFSKDEIKGRRITDMTEVTRLEDATLEGVECSRVKGRLASFNTVIWVDKGTFLIRRIERVSDNGVENTVNYEPKLNENIPDMELEFNAPQ